MSFVITCFFENGDKVRLRHLVIAVIIVKDKKVLMCKRGTYNGKPILEFGKWGLMGGYVDRDETLVEAARRETVEESGWEIENVTLFKIVDNPDRPNDNNRQNVSMVFVADAVSQKSVKTEEVAELKWFDLDNLPPEGEIAFDFYDALEDYKRYLVKKFPLPVLD
jgi:ADP-ribose pyrophosphatase YjhB (NUDIX family)